MRSSPVWAVAVNSGAGNLSAGYRAVQLEAREVLLDVARVGCRVGRGIRTAVRERVATVLTRAAVAARIVPAIPGIATTVSPGSASRRTSKPTACHQGAQTRANRVGLQPSTSIVAGDGLSPAGESAIVDHHEWSPASPGLARARDLAGVAARRSEAPDGDADGDADADADGDADAARCLAGAPAGDDLVATPLAVDLPGDALAFAHDGTRALVCGVGFALTAPLEGGVSGAPFASTRRAARRRSRSPAPRSRSGTAACCSSRSPRTAS